MSSMYAMQQRYLAQEEIAYARRRCLAVHEAAHAVTAAVYDTRVESICLIPDLESAGRVHLKPGWAASAGAEACGVIGLSGPTAARLQAKTLAATGKHVADLGTVHASGRDLDLFNLAVDILADTEGRISASRRLNALTLGLLSDDVVWGEISMIADALLASPVNTLFKHELFQRGWCQPENLRSRLNPPAPPTTTKPAATSKSPPPRRPASRGVMGPIMGILRTPAVQAAEQEAMRAIAAAYVNGIQAGAAARGFR